MVELKDYKLEDGGADWDAYRKAQVEAGDRCCRCGRRSPAGYFADVVPGAQLCPDCRALDSPEELTHDDKIRCPKCGDYWTPAEHEQYEVYEEEEHTVACDCGYRFTVSTTVSYSFTSPVRLNAGGDGGEK